MTEKAAHRRPIAYLLIWDDGDKTEVEIIAEKAEASIRAMKLAAEHVDNNNFSMRIFRGREVGVRIETIKRARIE